MENQPPPTCPRGRAGLGEHREGLLKSVGSARGVPGDGGDGWMDAAMEAGSEPSGDDGGILLTGTFFPALAHPSSSRRQRVGRGPRVWMGVHEGGMGGWGSFEADAQPWDHPQAGVPHAQERPPCPQLSPRLGCAVSLGDSLTRSRVNPAGLFQVCRSFLAVGRIPFQHSAPRQVWW